MSGPTSLHVIAKEGDLKTLQSALKSHSPNVEDNDGMRPLHYAAWYGHPGCCQALIAAGADINAFDHDGATALHAAAYNGQLSTLLALVEAGADATITDNGNATAAQVASDEDKTEASAFLAVVEEDQRNEKELVRLEEQFNQAKEKAKASKARLAKMVKETKRVVAEQEKEAKKIAKVTLKARKRKSRNSVPQAGPVPAADGATKPVSFSQLTGSLPGSTSTDGTSSKSSRISSRKSSQHSSDGGSRSSRHGDVDMLLAEIGADKDDEEALVMFMKRLDLQEFSRLLLAEHMTLDRLVRSSSSDLKKMGLPPIAVKKIASVLQR